MTPTEAFATSVITLLTAQGGRLIFRFVTRGEDRRRADADTGRVVAETAHLASESYAQPFQQALQFIEEMKEERASLRKEVDQLRLEVEGLRLASDKHERTLRQYRRLLEENGIAVPAA